MTVVPVCAAATREDGSGTNKAIDVPEGARFQLDPSIDCDTWPSLRYVWQRQMCRTLQVYGAIIVDTTRRRDRDLRPVDRFNRRLQVSVGADIAAASRTICSPTLECSPGDSRPGSGVDLLLTHSDATTRIRPGASGGLARHRRCQQLPPEMIRAALAQKLELRGARRVRLVSAASQPRDVAGVTIRPTRRRRLPGAEWRGR